MDGDLEVREVTGANSSGNLFIDGNLSTGVTAQNIWDTQSDQSIDWSSLYTADVNHWKGMTTNGGRRVASFYFYEDLVAGTGETFMMPLGRIEEGDIRAASFWVVGWRHGVEGGTTGTR